MNQTDFDDETLMAYADGALDTETSQRVADAAKADPHVAERIEMFRQSATLLGALGAERQEAPISDSLAARIEDTLAAARAENAATENVVPFSAKPARPAWVPMALAASVALVVGGLGGLTAGLSVSPDTPAGNGVASLDHPSVATALDQLGAGQTDDTGRVAIIASFLTENGTFCREFEYDTPDSETLVSVACREDDAWLTRFAVLASGADDASYAPASSLETLDTYLSAIGATAPMSVDEEAEFLAK